MIPKIILMVFLSYQGIFYGNEAYGQPFSPSKQIMNVEVNCFPTRPYFGTTLVSCLNPLLTISGYPEWSMVQLQGVLGHAFHFEMVPGGGFVMHDNLDWGSRALSVLSDLVKFQNFNATKHDINVDLPTLMNKAREAVRVSLDQGAPALVWQPMTPEMKANQQYAFCWGLIVGYNTEEETYTIRHPNLDYDYTIRYDALGKTDGAQWFNIRIFQQVHDLDENSVHLFALRNAVAFAKGLRFVEEHGKSQRGFLAYNLWQSAFQSKDISPEPSCYHIEILRGRRQVATLYLQELIPKFPEIKKQLGEAITFYQKEIESLDKLHGLLSLAREKGTFTPKERSKARLFIAEALKQEKLAVNRIEAGVITIDAAKEN